MFPQLEYLKAITVSGGEPLQQWRGVHRLLELSRNAGVHTAIETTLTAEESAIAALLPLVDVWLVGLRPVEPFHPGLNVPEPSLTASKLALLPPDRVIIRYPVIPGYTDCIDGAASVAWVMKQLGIRRIEILPYNGYSALYYYALGCDFPMEATVTPDSVAGMEEFFRAVQLDATVLRS